MPPGTKRPRSRRTWRAYGKHVAKGTATGAAGGAITGLILEHTFHLRQEAARTRLAAAAVAAADGALVGAVAGGGSHLF